MNRRLHSAAQQELDQAFSYYSSIDTELGNDFRNRILSAAHEICEFPFSCRLREGDYRRINLARFPFYLPYIIREETLIILAIAHNSRLPEYWKERIL